MNYKGHFPLTGMKPNPKSNSLMLMTPRTTRYWLNRSIYQNNSTEIPCIMKNLEWIKNSSNNYTQECIFLHNKESKKTQQAKHDDPLQFCLIHQNQSPVKISRIKHCICISHNYSSLALLVLSLSSRELIWK